MENEYLRKILKFLNQPFPKENITIADEGYNNKVFLMNDLDIAIKIIKKSEENAKNEMNVLNYINEKINIPIPIIKHSDFSRKIIPHPFVVMNIVPGFTLKKHVKSNKANTEIFYELGKIKGKINSIKNIDYGGFKENKIDNYQEVLHNEWNKIKLKLNMSELNKEFIIEQDNFFNKNLNLTKNDVGPCLVHGDTSLNNILIKDGKISGILDFEYAHWGCGIQDLFSSIRGFNVFFSNKKELIKGYSEYIETPREWEKLMYFYQWFANIKALSQIGKMFWRDLNKEDTNERKKTLRETYILNCKKYIKAFYDINIS